MKRILFSRRKEPPDCGCVVPVNAKRVPIFYVMQACDPSRMLPFKAAGTFASLESAIKRYDELMQKPDMHRLPQIRVSLVYQLPDGTFVGSHMLPALKVEP